MFYSAVSVTSSATMDITTEKKVFLHSLFSNKGLCNHSPITRSHSSNLLCCSSNNFRAASMQPKHKDMNSIVVFPLQLSVSILPNQLRSFFFGPEKKREMKMGQKGINFKENTVESTEEETIHRSNWVQKLRGIKTYWRGKGPKENMDLDTVSEHDNECDCDAEDTVCVAGDEEGNGKEEDGEEVTFYRDSFSKFLVPVPWSDTKLFSKLVFLCHMAYVIPQIKVCRELLST